MYTIMALSNPKVGGTIKDKTLTCTLCQEIYLSPIILPCLHTYCEKCIRDFITSIARTKTEERLTEFSCPTCRIPVKSKDPELDDMDKWTSSLTKNVVMEIMITLREGRQPQCQTCARFNETTAATVWCPTCDEAMCERCNDMHNRMKLLNHHRVVRIENISEELSGLYPKAISTMCSCQHSKQIEDYCRNHDELFCYSCRDTEHRECKNIYDIRTLIETDCKFNNHSENLTKLLETIVELQTEKESEKEKIKTKVEGLIEEAKNSIEGIKIKLDSVFESFKKTVLVFHEEEVTKANVRLRLLEQLAKNVEHWLAASHMLKKQNSDKTGFVFIHAVKKQLRESIKEILKLLKPEVISDLVYQQSDLIRKLEKCDDIWSFTVKKKYPHDKMDSIYECCESLDVSLNSLFENVELKFHRTISVKGVQNLRCGECLDERFIVVGGGENPGKLYMIEISTGSVVSSAIVEGDVKRLCIDKKHNQIFVSCLLTKLFRVRLQNNEFQTAGKLFPFNNNFVGDMVVRGDDVFVIVNGGIKKFASTVYPYAMTTCFDTNTDSRGENGMSTYKENVIFTTNEKEVKCITADGKDIFCFKDPAVKSPTSLSALPSGAIFVLDSKLHLLSTDGYRCRTILDRFETVASPGYIWIDSVGRTLYVCGGKNIDVYQVL